MDIAALLEYHQALLDPAAGDDADKIPDLGRSSHCRDLLTVQVFHNFR